MDKGKFESPAAAAAAARARALFMAEEAEAEVESFVLVLLVVFVEVFEPAGLPDEGGQDPGSRPEGKTENKLFCCCVAAELSGEAPSPPRCWPRFMAAGKAGEAPLLGILPSSRRGFFGLLPSVAGSPVAALTPLWYLLAI